jgi:hypothetical protein
LNDRRTIHEVLLLLPHRERAELVKDALTTALAGLPEQDAEPIRAMTRQLSDRVQKLGELTALEVLAAIGAVWSDNGAGS